MHETQGSHVIHIDELTRVEGQGAFYVRVEGGRVTDSRFKIFEPPRFFEAFLRGRSHAEVPDITARICGICPVAYQMSSAHALESIFGALPDTRGPIARLRRLFYAGEWLESHSLHAFFLHLPDFLGKHSAFEIAKESPEIIERGINLRRAGNEIIIKLGGRPMHPVGASVGGWHRAPRQSELNELIPLLERGLEDAVESARWMRERLTFPEFEQDYEFIALRGPREYPFNEGMVASSRGWEIPCWEWDEAIEERQVEHSNAYQAVLRGNGSAYFCGPLARYNLNHDLLTPRAAELAAKLGLEPPVQNPYLGILVRLVECVFCFEESLSVIRNYTRPEQPAAELDLHAGEGAWATEAPRGLLFHRYRVEDDGRIASARIIPPTSQNQARIEMDLTALVQRSLHMTEHDISHACEFMIRNYDPCISCATHFLKFHMDRK